MKVLMFQHVRVILACLHISVLLLTDFTCLEGNTYSTINIYQTIFVKKIKCKNIELMKYFLWIYEHGHRSSIFAYFNSWCLLKILPSNAAIIFGFLHFKNFTSNLGLVIFGIWRVVLETNEEVVEHVELHIRLF